MVALNQEYYTSGYHYGEDDDGDDDDYYDDDGYDDDVCGHNVQNPDKSKIINTSYALARTNKDQWRGFD